MTISNETNRIQYNGNGVTTAFAFPYYFFATSDLVVILTDTTTSTDTTQVIGTDYTASGTLIDGVYSSGGTITFNTVPASGKRITIYRELTYTQETDYTNVDAFPEEAHEQALDRLTILTQQIKDDLKRSLLLPTSTTLSGLTIPSPEANKYLGWNATANNLENKETVEVSVTLPSFGGNALNYPRINAGANNFEYRTPANVRSDIKLVNAGNPNGSITGTDEGERLYDTTNDILYVYSGSGTVWYSIGGVRSGSLPANYHDVRIDYTDTNTITVLAGSRVRSSDDTTDIIFSANLTCALDVSGVNGLDTGSEAANTWYYLYAIYNPATLTSARLFSTVNEAVSGSITLPSGFTKKRQLRIAVRNNASSDIIPFSYRSLDAFIRFQNFETGVSPYRVYSGASTSWTGVSLATLAPPISTTVQLQSLYASDSAGVIDRSAFLRKTGTSLTAGIQIASTALSYESSLFVWDTDTNSSQSVDIRCTNVNGTLFLDVLGFYVTEVK